MPKVARRVGVARENEQSWAPRPEPIRAPRTRPKVADYLPLDVRSLARSGVLMAGKELCVPLRAVAGGPVVVVRVRIEGEGLSFGFASAGSRMCGRVRVERTRCPYGGTRPWLCCPRCNSRRSCLYGVDRFGSFSCRRCMQLVYSSQDERKMDRLWRRRRKLEAKLGRMCRRPKGMHWRTFEQICTDLNAVLGQEDALFIRGARRLLDRTARPPGSPRESC